MAYVQEGVQVLFDEIESSDASSSETTSTGNSGPKDYHQEAYESYVPPHKRGHNTQEDKFVNLKKNNEEDKKEGVDHDKYQRIKIDVPFALPREKLLALKKDLPGAYFHCRDNGNHDHPFSHMVTVFGTRMLQRRIKPGSRVLDVYGNPNACDRFNASQSRATDPKSMKALFQRCGPTDFIREVNKVGPFFDDEAGAERYHRGNLMSLVTSGEIKKYDVLQLVHTLYYVPFQELAAALHAPCDKKRKRVAYALIHRHAHESGSINDGEQTYSKKWVGNERLVRQVNVSTNSSYVHPDVASKLFVERKSWVPEPKLQERGVRTTVDNRGLTWECHIINDETWVVEFAPYIQDEVEGFVDYAAMWDDDECLFDADPFSTPTESTDESIQFHGNNVIIPTSDGKFLKLDVPSKELFNHLRSRASGRERTPKLMEELISTANHLVNPSTLFGDKVGMKCPPDKIYEVAAAAWAVDVPREALIANSITMLKPVLLRHARSLKLGPKYKDLCLRDLMSSIGLALQGVRDVNHVLKAKDPLDLGIQHLQGYLS